MGKNSLARVLVHILLFFITGGLWALWIFFKHVFFPR